MGEMLRMPSVDRYLLVLIKKRVSVPRLMSRITYENLHTRVPKIPRRRPKNVKPLKYYVLRQRAINGGGALKISSNFDQPR